MRINGGRRLEAGHGEFACGHIILLAWLIGDNRHAHLTRRRALLSRNDDIRRCTEYQPALRLEARVLDEFERGRLIVVVYRDDATRLVFGMDRALTLDDFRVSEVYGLHNVRERATGGCRRRICYETGGLVEGHRVRARCDCDGSGAHRDQQQNAEYDDTYTSERPNPPTRQCAFAGRHSGSLLILAHVVHCRT